MTWATLARFRKQSGQISRNVRLFLWTVFLSNVGASGIFALLYNLYLVELGHKEDFIGLLSFIQMLAIAVGAIPSGSLADRFGCSRVMAAGTAIMGLGTLGQCLLVQPVLIGLLNVVTGLGFALRIVPYTPFLVNNTTRTERTLVFSANSAAISIAGTVGGLIGGQLPALFAQLFALPGPASVPAYRASLLIGAALALAATVPMALASECTDFPTSVPTQPVNEAVTANSAKRSQRDVRIFTTVTILFALSAASIMPFINVYFSQSLGLSAAAISVIFSTSSILAAVATIGASDIANRIGKVRTMVAIRLVGAPLLALLAIKANVWLATAAILVRNVTEMASWPLDGAFLAEVIPLRRQARTAAYRSMAWNATWALTSFVAGQVIVRVGYRPLFVVAATVLATAAAVYHFGFSSYNQIF